MHRISRFAILVLALAAGASAAYPAVIARSCGAIRDQGDPVGITVQRGKVQCATARKVLRT